MYWIGAAAMAASLAVSFGFPQRTAWVRGVILALGLVGLGITTARFINDQRGRKKRVSIGKWRT